MSQSTKVGIIGGGWPGVAHARGYKAAGGYSIAAVADLIPQRREQLATEAVGAKQYLSAQELLEDRTIEVVSLCVPTHLHLSMATAAFKAGKHVVLEAPPALNVRESRQLAAVAQKRGRKLAFAYQRRFGGAELAARQAIEKDYVGDAQHISATWMRTRGVPIGTGWYTDRARSGGGALLDLGSHMLDLGWYLLGQPPPESVYAVVRRQFPNLSPAPTAEAEVEDAAFAFIQFEGNKLLELGVSWAINQAPAHNGTRCRVYGSTGAVEVYTPNGPVLYRQFNSKGEAKATVLKQPKVTGHAAMLRQFRECLLGKSTPGMSGAHAIVLMQMIEAMYKSAQTGRSVEVKADAVPVEKNVEL